MLAPPGIRTQNLGIKSVVSRFPTLISLHQNWLLPAVMFPGLINRIQDSPGFVAQRSLSESCDRPASSFLGCSVAPLVPPRYLRERASEPAHEFAGITCAYSKCHQRPVPTFGQPFEPNLGQGGRRGVAIAMIEATQQPRHLSRRELCPRRGGCWYRTSSLFWRRRRWASRDLRGLQSRARCGASRG